jgi:hypothetical protein
MTFALAFMFDKGNIQNNLYERVFLSFNIFSGLKYHSTISNWILSGSRSNIKGYFCLFTF